MILPDKYIRKAIFQAANNLVVSGYTVPCYDTRATNEEEEIFILMTTQSNSPRDTKCGWSWESTVVVQVNHLADKNTGDRLLADDVAQAFLDAIDGMELDPGSGLSITYRSIEFPADLAADLEAEILYQKVIRLTFGIN